jgi:hypothetical protein
MGDIISAPCLKEVEGKEELGSKNLERSRPFDRRTVVLPHIP